MANTRDEEDLFSSDFGSDFDYDDTTTLPLRANFDLAGVVDVSDGNGDNSSSRSSSPASDRRSDDDDGSNNNNNMILNLKNAHILLHTYSLYLRTTTLKLFQNMTASMRQM